MPTPAGAPEVVDGDGVHALLGEAQAEFFVEREQAADVGHDDDTHAVGFLGAGGEGGELRAVGSLEHQVLGIDGRAGDRGDRRVGIMGDTHSGKPRGE